MKNYQEARVKLTNTKLKKIKSAAKNNTGTTLKIDKKNFCQKELPHELFLATRLKLINKSFLLKYFNRYKTQ